MFTFRRLLTIAVFLANIAFAVSLLVFLYKAGYATDAHHSLKVALKVLAIAYLAAVALYFIFGFSFGGNVRGFGPDDILYLFASLIELAMFIVAVIYLWKDDVYGSVNEHYKWWLKVWSIIGLVFSALLFLFRVIAGLMPRHDTAYRSDAP